MRSKKKEKKTSIKQKKEKHKNLFPVDGGGGGACRLINTGQVIMTSGRNTSEITLLSC